MSDILNSINELTSEYRKQLAVLIDPDKFSEISEIEKTIEIINQSRVDYIFIGGSLITNGTFHTTVNSIKELAKPKVIIFPGSLLQIHDRADALLLLSLISGRNPEMLIGHHVIAAPKLKASGLEILPTGYMLIDSSSTAASYMSNTTPIPYEKDDIAACTAMAGEMLGLKLIYMDGGSGAKRALSTEMISKVKSSINIPLIVGGGIRTIEEANRIWNAGADIIVVGNAIEERPEFIKDLVAKEN